MSFVKKQGKVATSSEYLLFPGFHYTSRRPSVMLVRHNDLSVGVLCN